MILRAFRGAIAAIAILSSSSCIGMFWWPDSGQDMWDRGVIPVEVRATFQPGHVTRADVMSALGDPDWISSDERRMVYQVRILSSHFDVYLGAGGSSWMFGDLHSDLFAFSDDGRLLSHRLVTEPYQCWLPIQHSHCLDPATLEAEMSRLFALPLP